MDSFLVGIVGIVVLLCLLAAGVHIALCLGVTGLIGLILLKGLDTAGWLATSVSYYIVATPSMMVIPLFVFMGALAGTGGISRSIYQALSMWSGRAKGSLGVATVASCTAFGVVTGSSMVTAAVFTKISAPEMRRFGYEKRFAYGICAASGAIGMLIPPSILIVIYAILSEQSAGRLLIAGIAPGLLLAIFFSAGIMIMGHIRPALVGGGAVPLTVTWRQRFTSLRSLWPIIICALIMILGIYMGVFSANEAAAFGALVITTVTIITGGRERWKTIAGGMIETVTITAMIFFILTGAGIFARFLMISGITPKLLGFVIGLNLPQIYFVIAMAVIYLILGCFLDSISMLSITLPVIIPVATAMGINPIYFAMVQIVAIETGLLTPPVGLNVYASKAVAERDVSLEDIFRGTLPFFLTMVAVLVLMISVPWVTTILPSLMFD